MSWAWMFLVVSAVGALMTLNAFLPQRRALTLLPSFFASWLTNELAVHHLAWQLVATAIFVAEGALSSWPGWVGLGLALVSWAGLVVLIRASLQASQVVEKALVEALGADYRRRLHRRPRADGATHAGGVGAPLRRGGGHRRIGAPGRGMYSAVPLGQLIFPFPRQGRQVERIRNVVYAEVGGKRLRMDIHRRKDQLPGAPILLQIHGGGWVIGRKDNQGQPLVALMAEHGWVCFNANYRLSPRATFPDHLVDLKRALAWIRAHAAEYGGDPDFIVVTGGSAGGHLAALMALTANDAEYQPEFEEADTAVQACIPYYGVYDFTNRTKAWHKDGFEDFLGRVVMKVSVEQDPGAYAKASPIDRVHAGAAPFFVIHGALDTLAPVADARLFVERLRAVSHEPVAYAELPRTQHAFDVFPSIRTASVIRGAERFADWVHARYLERAAGEGVASGRLPSAESSSPGRR